MDLIERYVNEVGRKLPRKGREDIKAELRSTLRDMADDHYQGQATEDDLVELLKEYGSPQRVAASYRPAGQYLIGPELYPYFRMIVGLVFLATTIAFLVSFAVSFIFGDAEPAEFGQALLDMLLSLFQAYLSGIASVVLVFAVLQYVGANYLDIKVEDGEGKEWNPRRLPKARDVDLVNRFESMAAIAAGLVFLVLVNLFADRIGFVISWGDEPMFTNILQDNLVWLNIAMVAGILLNILLLFQGRWFIYSRLAKMVVDLYWIFVVSQFVSSLAGERVAMVAAGLTEPLPTMFVGIGYFIIVAMFIGFIVNLVKWIVGEFRWTVAEGEFKPKLN